MNNDGIGKWIEAVLTIGVVVVSLYALYRMVRLYVKPFEILFGSGWWYIAFLVLGSVLSIINIPLYKTRERDTIHVNVGGCILPLLLSGYLLHKTWFALDPTMIVVASLITILVSRLTSWYVKGTGVLIVAIAVEFTSTLIAHFLPFSVNYLNSDLLPLKLAFGYIIGTIGVLVGGDLLHIGMIGRDGSWGDKLSMGGAGTKDGVWSIGLGTMFLILISRNIFGW